MEKRKYKLELHWCGDEVCDCHHFTIYKEVFRGELEFPHWVKNENSWWHKVWDDGTWFHIERDAYWASFLNKLRMEIKDACDKLGLKADMSSDNLYDWELIDV
jgi:hypothetical protein